MENNQNTKPKTETKFNSFKNINVKKYAPIFIAQLIIAVLFSIVFLLFISGPLASFSGNLSKHASLQFITYFVGVGLMFGFIGLCFYGMILGGEYLFMKPEERIFIEVALK